MSEKRIYVFSLSKKDESFKDGKIETAVNWLESKHEEPYYFRGKKPKSLPSGSTVLFSFQGQIFGQATVKREPKELSLEERKQAKEYKYSMVLNGSSVEIFPKPYKRKKDLKYILYPKKGFGQLFTYLTQNQYQEILRHVRGQT